MVRRFTIKTTLLVLLLLFSSAQAGATAKEGFLEGPYLMLLGGTLDFNWDVNQRTGAQQGSAIEPILAVGFGWNVFDWMAPELLLRYTTDSNNGRREHISDSTVGLTLTWVAKFLNDFEKWRILPFIRPGMTVQIAALPADPLSGIDTVITKGFGPNVGAGIRFTFKEYFFFGGEVDAEWINQEGVSQNLTPGGPTTIYQGGWKRQLGIMGMVGIHF